LEGWTLTEVFLKIVDKVADLFFSNATKREEAKQTKRNEIVQILEQVWKTTEEVHMEIRALYKPHATDRQKQRAKAKYIASIRRVNQLIAQNEIYIDRAIYQLAQDYFASLFALCDVVYAYGSEDDQEDLASSACQSVSNLAPILKKYDEFNNKRDALLTVIKSNIVELSGM
jgi:hypothetical protein